MAITYKILGQKMSSVTTPATTPVTVYTAGAQAVVSTITVCNQVSSGASYSVAVVPAATGSAVPLNYIVYNAPIAGNDTTALTLGITLATGDKIITYASTSTISFSAFGSEIA
jgi:hypothetical protein